ncbi:MAG: hydroxymethylglutaryl-CoA lyase [Chitinophagaceae bacterium]|nr:MAG: hydroxymethylglutaryl-CoA lyase [Chitinophagaceae bacterium]
MNKKIKLIECPRDAMQGWKQFIPSEKKIEYLNSLIQIGFHTIDFGSFVSEKAIPQMADTKKIIPHLQLDNSISKLLAIVANIRGATEAVEFDEITYLGFPFSVSEIFQKRNTNSTIEESLKTVEAIQSICHVKSKELVIYISMGFGNPYGEKFNNEIVFKWVNKLHQLGIKTISIADTVGIATAAQVNEMMSSLISEFSKIEIGVHLHSTPLNWGEKFEAAYRAGCFRFDGALKGFGGCPMAGNDLVGNMNTEFMISYLEKNNIPLQFNQDALNQSIQLASEIFAN